MRGDAIETIQAYILQKPEKMFHRRRYLEMFGKFRKISTKTNEIEFTLVTLLSYNQVNPTMGVLLKISHNFQNTS